MSWSLHRIKGEGGDGRGGLIDHMIWFAAIIYSRFAQLLHRHHFARAKLEINLSAIEISAIVVSFSYRNNTSSLTTCKNRLSVIILLYRMHSKTW